MRASQIVKKLREHANHIEAKYNNTQEVCHDLRVAATKLEEMAEDARVRNLALKIIDHDICCEIWYSEQSHGTEAYLERARKGEVLK